MTKTHNNKPLITLTRHVHEDNQTIGMIYGGPHNEEFSLLTIEPPWKDNKPFVSCIPVGTYRVTKWDSPAHGRCFKIHDVPDRTDILIHKGNFFKNTKGCILPGFSSIDIDGDGYRDIVDSKKALNAMLNVLPEEFYLKVE